MQNHEDEYSLQHLTETTSPSQPRGRVDLEKRRERQINEKKTYVQKVWDDVGDIRPDYIGEDICHHDVGENIPRDDVARDMRRDDNHDVSASIASIAIFSYYF